MKIKAVQVACDFLRDSMKVFACFITLLIWHLMRILIMILSAFSKLPVQSDLEDHPISILSVKCRAASSRLDDAWGSLKDSRDAFGQALGSLMTVLYAVINILFWNVMKVSMVILAAVWGLAALLGPGVFLMMKGAPIWFSVCAATVPQGFMGAFISMGLGAVLLSAMVGAVFAVLCLKPMRHYGGPCIEYISKKSDLAQKALHTDNREGHHARDVNVFDTRVLIVPATRLDLSQTMDPELSSKKEVS